MIVHSDRCAGCWEMQFSAFQQYCYAFQERVHIGSVAVATCKGYFDDSEIIPMQQRHGNPILDQFRRYGLICSGKAHYKDRLMGWNEKAVRIDYH